MDSKFVKVAKIVATHGLSGDVKIIPIITPPKMLKKINRLFMLEKDNSYETLIVQSIRPGPKAQWILKVSEWQNIDEVEGLKGTFLYIPQEDLPQLPQHSYYLADLIGCRVICDGEELGLLTDVLQTGANDVYMIETASKKQILLPAVREFVLSVDIENKTIHVVLPNGLLDL